jgi:hypothetical protein
MDVSDKHNVAEIQASTYDFTPRLNSEQQHKRQERQVTMKLKMATLNKTLYIKRHKGIFKKYRGTSGLTEGQQNWPTKG